jgi:VIT1/CCC1 family predicted Fe2+/Mn2+ transporter
MPRTPTPPRGHSAEAHRVHRGAWLRAAVLGADDGIVSVSGLMVGIAGSGAGRSALLTGGMAGLIAGALSMAAGEYVSVSSQRDSERADLAREADEIVHFPDAEMRELTEIYVKRGLERDLARQVAEQLHEHDALGAHVRDELGLDPQDLADPRRAAAVSALSFAVGAALPLGVSAIDPHANAWLIVVVALVALAVLGLLSARTGGAAPGRAVGRVVIGGGLALGITWVIGRFVGVLG